MKNWPEGSNITCKESVRSFPPLKKEEMETKVEYLYSVTFPAPEIAGVRPLYIAGRGHCKSTWFAHGYGTTMLEAEDAAWNNYQKIVNCPHVIEKIAHVDLPDDQPKVYLLDGDAICKICEIYLPYYFMDDRLHRSMCLAHRAHENQKRKYGDRCYIVHPKEVYNRTAFWKPKRSEEDRVVMGCAAWEHDIKEDCPNISDEEIIAAGGKEAFILVCELTNPSKGSKAPRAVRKQMDRDHLKEVSHPAKIIKMIDRICNLNDLHECPEMDFLALYAKESRLLWEVIHDADEKLAQELNSVIEQVERRSCGQNS